MVTSLGGFKRTEQRVNSAVQSSAVKLSAVQCSAAVMECVPCPHQDIRHRDSGQNGGVCSLQFALCNVQCAVWIVHCAVHSRSVQ